MWYKVEYESKVQYQHHYEIQPNQVMTGSDKLFHKKVLKICKSRGLADDSINENPYYKSQYNDDRNLTNFENDQIFRHQVRSVNDNSVIELENDNDALDNINDNDEIFALRRHKNQADADQLLESSGDDLDKDYDNLLVQQNEDNTIDIDTVIQNENDNISEQSEEEIKTRSNKRGRRAIGVNLNEIKRHIKSGNNENNKRMLELSEQFNTNMKDKNNIYDSDGSSYYNSSNNEIDDIERNTYKDAEDYNIAEEGVGKVFWGEQRKNYYGADANNKGFKHKSLSMQDQQLRDEELIGMQMQKDEMKYTKECNSTIQSHSNHSTNNI
eukprot:479027_1